MTFIWKVRVYTWVCVRNRDGINEFLEFRERKARTIVIITISITFYSAWFKDTLKSWLMNCMKLSIILPYSICPYIKIILKTFATLQEGSKQSFNKRAERVVRTVRQIRKVPKSYQGRRGSFPEYSLLSNNTQVLYSKWDVVNEWFPLLKDHPIGPCRWS